MKTLIMPIAILLLLSSCLSINKKNENSENKQQKDNADSEIVVRKKYNDEGRVITEVPYKGELKNGIARHYYPNGQVSMEIPYVNNLKQGTSNYYYTDGKIYRTTPYVNGKINGIRKLYYENGNLMAEVPYRNDQPIPGLKEWTEDGKLLTHYPKLKFKEINKLGFENKVVLQIYFSDNSKNVEFYQLLIKNNKDTARVLLIEEHGIAEIDFYVGKGKMRTEKVDIIGIKKTRRRNPYVQQATYNLAVENRLF